VWIVVLWIDVHSRYVCGLWFCGLMYTASMCVWIVVLRIDVYSMYVCGLWFCGLIYIGGMCVDCGSVD
jgi:hypothetical protein